MYVTHLECPQCGAHYDHRQLAQTCPECNLPLLVKYDLAKVKNTLRKTDLAARSYNLWRYKELLPVEDQANSVSLGEVVTPLIPLEKKTFICDQEKKLIYTGAGGFCRRVSLTFC